MSTATDWLCGAGTRAVQVWRVTLCVPAAVVLKTHPIVEAVFLPCGPRAPLAPVAPVAPVGPVAPGGEMAGGFESIPVPLSPIVLTPGFDVLVIRNSEASLSPAAIGVNPAVIC